MSDIKDKRSSRYERRQKIKKLTDGCDIAGAAMASANDASKQVYARAEIRKKLSAFLSPKQIGKLERVRSQKPGR